MVGLEGTSASAEPHTLPQAGCPPPAQVLNNVCCFHPESKCNQVCCKSTIRMAWPEVEPSFLRVPLTTSIRLLLLLPRIRISAFKEPLFKQSVLCMWTWKAHNLSVRASIVQY